MWSWAFCSPGGLTMEQQVCELVHPGIITIQGMLRKIDCLRLPVASRRDVESILVRQVTKELDRALPWHAGHGRRTAAISLLIGQAVGLAPNELHDLKLAAFLHDIGLLMLPHALTIWVNSFDSESHVTVQNHPRLGALLLEPFFFLREASVLVAHHHERWDGSGYPYGIGGRFIPLGARILAIADAFDAIRIPEVSNPVARNKIALRILRVAAGTQFDPQLVETLRLFQKSIPGSEHAKPTMRNCFDSQYKYGRFHHVSFQSSAQRVSSCRCEVNSDPHLSSLRGMWFREQ
jgi:HD-GYP domain-containing protein (c-di-GMP phosphodiesterase class II)